MGLKATLIAAAIAALPLSAAAAGLGRLNVLSALGQPLRAEVELSASGEELASLSAKMASAEAFKQAGIDYTPALSTIRFKVDRRPDGNAVLKISSDRPINDPFIDLLLEVNWANGRLVREYTFLLDPAEAGKPQQVAPSAPPVAPPESRPVQAGGSGRKVTAPAPAAERTPTGDTYQVKRGDTLSKIASQTAPEGVSVEQMLVALYDRNKDAFDGNMNRLKAGRILSVPDKEAAAGVSQPEAKRIVTAQTADFSAYRAKLAEAAKAAPAAPLEAPQQAAGGKITPKVEEKAPAVAPGQDQVKVSKADAKDVKATQRLAQLEEENAAKERALKEANSRLADLEKNVKDLQGLVELKNKNLAELQKQASAKGPERPALPPVETVKPAEPAKVAAGPKPATEAQVSAEKPKPAEPPKPAETMPAPVSAPVAETKPEAPKPEAPKPEAAAKPRPAPAPTPAPEQPGFFRELFDNPATLAGGGGLLALLIGWGVYRARQRTQATDSSMPVPSLAPSTHTGNSVFGTSGGQSVDTSSQIQTDFSQSAMTAIDTDEGVDPVAEADVYMAYGRDAQAEEILLDALKNEPTRHAIHVKLLEIYAQRKSTKQFENLATQLFSLTGGTGADWDKAAAMGLKLDPANPLFGGAKTAVKPAAEAPAEAIPVGPLTIPLGTKPAEAPTALMSSSQMMKDTWTIPGELSQMTREVDGDAAQNTVVIQNVAEGESTNINALGKLDFNLDLGDEPEPAAAPVEDRHSGGAGMAAGMSAAAASAAAVAAISGRKPDANALDFDLASRVDSAPLPGARDSDIGHDVIDLTVTQPNDVKALDFDLDSVLSDTRGELAKPQSAELVVDLEKTDVGGSLADFDFELGETRPDAPTTAPPELDLSSISLELPSEAGSDAVSFGEESFSGAEETNTKLELARAYEEMGDREGARELLGEVMREGTGDQQAKAREMLAKLA